MGTPWRSQGTFCLSLCLAACDGEEREVLTIMKDRVSQGPVNGEINSLLSIPRLLFMQILASSCSFFPPLNE